MNLYQYTRDHLERRKQQREVREYGSYLNERQRFKGKAQAHRKSRLQDFVQEYSRGNNSYLVMDQYMSAVATKNQKEGENIPKNSLQLIRATGRSNFTNSYDSSPMGASKTKGFSLPSYEGQIFRLTDQDRKLLTYVPPAKPQRKMQSARTFNEKANRLMAGYRKDKERYEQVLRVSKDRHRLCQVTHFEEGLNRGSSLKKQTVRKEKEVENVEEGGQLSKSVYFSEVGQKRRKDRTYFKLAKTAQLFSTDRQQRAQLNDLLSRSQYDRIKKVQKDQLLGSTMAQSFMSSRGRKSVELSLLG